MQGQIVKGIAGFYFVKSGEKIYRCRARGIFKNQGMKPAVGDHVLMEEAEGEDDSLITEVLPRKNSFIRPFVANVDCFVIVTSVARPDPVMQVIDKLLLTAEQAMTEAVICINKCDLTSGQKGQKSEENMEALCDIYRGLYPVICTSKEDEESLIELEKIIRGRTVALTGASGAGKSTILNRLMRDEHMQTGSISEKSERGRHTTRHAELFSLDDEGTMVFDTPGFTSYDLPRIEPSQIGSMFPEIEEAGEGCRYDDCMHMAEPGCRVKSLLETGDIKRSRYESYCAFVKEAQSQKQY